MPRRNERTPEEETYRNEIRRNIRAVRKLRGWRQIDLVDRIGGVGKNYVTDMEVRRERYELPEMYRLAQALQCDVLELYQPGFGYNVHYSPRIYAEMSRLEFLDRVFRSNLMAIRTLRRIKQSEIGDAVGWSQTTIQTVEYGVTPIHDLHIYRLSKFFELQRLELFDPHTIIREVSRMFDRRIVEDDIDEYE